MGRRSTLGRNEFGCIYELRILNRHGRIEETVSRDDVSGGAGLFQHADCGLGDYVVCNDVAVAGEKDTGLGAVENMVLTDAGLIALRANAIENNGGEGFVALDLSIVAVNEDVDLADAGGVAGDLHIVGLRDENVGGNGGACGDGGTRRPDVIGHDVVENRPRSAKANLNAILRRTGGCADTCDNIPTNDSDGAYFVRGDAILLKVMDSAVVDFDFRDAAIATLHKDAGAALAAIEWRGELEITDSSAVEFSGSILERNADEVGRALRDAAIDAIHGQPGDGNVGCVRDQQRGGDRSSVEEAGRVRLHGGGDKGRAVVGIDFQRLADRNLLDVDTFANANLIARGGGVNRILDMSESCIGTLHFVVIHDQLGTSGR